MRKYFIQTTLLFLLLTCNVIVKSQDLLNELSAIDKDRKEPTTATFKGTRMVNGHSIETKGAGELEFIIGHRFGRLNSGGYNLFGLDQAYVRFGLEYGITNKLGIGVGRSSFNKIYDSYLKYKLISQQVSGGSPVTVTAFGSVNVQTFPQKSVDPTLSFADRLTYTSQLLIARKFSPEFSMQISPTFTHSNRVDQSSFNNDQLALGVGARYKITRSLAINMEYYHRINPIENTAYYNSLGIGFDIETGGHVFQLILSNSQGMIERTFLNETEGDFFKGDIHFGFNITRVFQVKSK